MITKSNIIADFDANHFLKKSGFFCNKITGFKSSLLAALLFHIVIFLYHIRKGGGHGDENIRKIAYFEQSIDPIISKVSSIVHHISLIVLLIVTMYIVPRSFKS